MALDEINYEQLGRAVAAYCMKYHIRIEDFLPILNDQKVIPMLHSKGLMSTGKRTRIHKVSHFNVS